MTTKTNGAAKWHKAKLVNALHNFAVGQCMYVNVKGGRWTLGRDKHFYLTLNTKRTFFSWLLHNFTRCTITAPRQLQAVLATIEQRRHQPEPNLGRSEHNPRSITATDQVIPDLASHAWHWFGCQIHWCWCCNSRCRWFRFVLVSFHTVILQIVHLVHLPQWIVQSYCPLCTFIIYSQLQSSIWGTHNEYLITPKTIAPGRSENWSKLVLCSFIS